MGKPNITKVDISFIVEGAVCLGVAAACGLVGRQRVDILHRFDKDHVFAAKVAKLISAATEADDAVSFKALVDSIVAVAEDFERMEASERVADRMIELEAELSNAKACIKVLNDSLLATRAILGAKDDALTTAKSAEIVVRELLILRAKLSAIRSYVAAGVDLQAEEATRG